MAFGTPTLRLSVDQHRRIVAHCYDGLPDEACGLLLGPAVGPMEEPTGAIVEVWPARNADASSRTYTVAGEDMLKATNAVEALNPPLVDGRVGPAEVRQAIVGCWHSHTHTEAYPSDTDVRTAAWNPSWLYVLVSLKHGDPVLRAYRIRDGVVTEIPVTLEA